MKEHIKMKCFLASEIKKRNELIQKLKEENEILLRSIMKTTEKSVTLENEAKLKQKVNERLLEEISAKD